MKNSIHGGTCQVVNTSAIIRTAAYRCAVSLVRRVVRRVFNALTQGTERVAIIRLIFQPDSVSYINSSWYVQRIVCERWEQKHGS